MTFEKALYFFAAGALLLTTSAVPSTQAIAADPPAKASPKRASAQGLPAPGTYHVDPTHSFTYFGAWHHIVGLVRGRFDKVTGTITVAQGPATCAVDITVDPATISTQNGERDEDLRGPDFFDVKKYPAVTYQGRGIRRGAGGMWVMDGSLTIRGVSKVVPLTFTFKGIFPDTPAGKPARASFHASAATRRGDFGMTRDNLMELGSSPTKPDVEIEIDVEADSSAPAK
jgi:polyisoprenoid-binding protein YceI